MRVPAVPHTSPSDLVDAMSKANRLRSTHVRAVLAHTVDRRNVLDELLENGVVKGLIEVDIHDMATVEAFACHLFGTSFHGLTFSMRAQPDGSLPLTERLTRIDPGAPEDGPVGAAAAALAPVALARSDAPRRGRSVFDGTSNEEFLVQLPALTARPRPGGARPGHDAHISFRQAAAQVIRLATELERPLSFVHAPVSAPTPPDVPRNVGGPCLRVAVAFPRFDDRLRLRFGADLIDVCCRQGYGLWHRGPVAGTAEHDYWRPMVRLAPIANPRLPTTYTNRADDHGLAVTCIGTATPGATEGLLHVLARAGAPLAGLAALTLDDMAIIHLMTRTRLGPDEIAALDPDERADVTLGHALGLDDPPRSERLERFRALVSTRVATPSPPDLAAIWLAWGTPATPEALRLTVRTLSDALDSVSSSYRGRAVAEQVSDNHLNIEYLVGREVSDDWLRGRMKVALDLRALGALANPDGTISPGNLGQFCSDVERRWRSLLTMALQTANVDLEVVWRESWIGRWANMHADPRDQRDEH
jgi:hypothetical protein